MTRLRSKSSAGRRLDVTDVPQAAAINCGICDFCPGVHVNLVGADGAIFASAVVPVEHVERFAADLCGAAAELRRRPHAAPAGVQ